MSAPTVPTWTDVVSKVLDIIKSVIYNIAVKIGENAALIAEVAVGLGILAFVVGGLFRGAPFIRRLLAPVGLPL